MGKQYMDMDFSSHEVQTIYPPITPYLYKKLEKKYVDYLWKIIKKGKKQKEEYKHRLAGNVSNSFGIVDEKQYFFNEIKSIGHENFYISACDALNLKRNNLYKYSKVLKFDNDFKAFTEDRLWQIKTWNENQKYFLNFLKENKISILYAYGSYFYLLFRVFNLKDLSFSLFISYIIYYPFYLSYKVIYLVKKIFKKK